MSHTLHWSNYARELDTTYDGTGKYNRVPLFKSYPDAYRQRIGNPTSVLSIQADVLYPNALAALEIELDDPLDPEIPHSSGRAVGCKGHQVDQPFLLEPRVPVTLPLVMYPTRTNNLEVVGEHDSCSIPVLNWENYISELKRFETDVYKSLPNKNRPRREPVYSAKRSLKLAKARLRFAYSMKEKEEYERWQQLLTDGAEEEDQEGRIPLLQESEVNVEDEEYISEYLAPGKMELEKKAIVNKVIDEMKVEPLKKGSREVKNFRRTRDAIRLALFNRPNFDLEKKEHEQTDSKTKMAYVDPKQRKKQCKTLFRNLEFKDLTLHSKKDRMKLQTLRNYKNQPEYRIMGTWNYLFNGHGACDWIRDSKDGDRRHILVGCGTKLRAVSVKPSRPTQMLSYTVDSIWEEDNFPSNIKVGRNLPDEALSDQILQIIAARKGGVHNNLSAVRRGRSIEIYRFDEIPSLVTSIGNICYGTQKYKAFSKSYNSRLKPLQVNPVLVSCDLNYWFPEELTMLDENNVLSFIDFGTGKTVYQTIPVREGRECYNNKVVQDEFLYPTFELNDSSGIAYANHPRTCYYWANSRIYFHDYRADVNSASSSSLELLNLKTNATARSWSEQLQFFDDRKYITEAVSNVKQSMYMNSMYYHVGTTSRLLLMDLRVPGNPVLKVDHGMKSPAAYLDVVHDDNFEVVIAGSQRAPEIFCAVHDRSHISCAERVHCHARNPILQSYPKLLSNPMEFLNLTQQQGYVPASPSDYMKARDHCYGWCTGLAAMKVGKSKSARMPPGFAIFQGNSFGDLFYQEWDQTPVENHRRTELTDHTFVEFLNDWKLALTSKNPSEYHRTSQNESLPTSCCLLMEASTEFIKGANKVRQEKFNSFKLNAEIFERVSRHLKPIEKQLVNLRKFNSDFSNELLSNWDTPVQNDMFNDQSGIDAIIKHNPPSLENYHDENVDSALRGLTEQEQQVLSEIKQESDVTDFEAINLNDLDSDVNIIDEFSSSDQGFNIVDVDNFDNENYSQYQMDEEEDEENNELLGRLLPSVRERFPLPFTRQDEEEVGILFPEDNIINKVEAEVQDEWVDVSVSLEGEDDVQEMSSEMEEQVEEDDSEEKVTEIPGRTIEPESSDENPPPELILSDVDIFDGIDLKSDEN